MKQFKRVVDLNSRDVKTSLIGLIILINSSYPDKKSDCEAGL